MPPQISNIEVVNISHHMVRQRNISKQYIDSKFILLKNQENIFVSRDATILKGDMLQVGCHNSK